MPQRRKDFYDRAIAKANERGVNWLKPHVYNTTTVARLAQGRHFVHRLEEHVKHPNPESFPREFNDFMMQDMYAFGAANSLRSALDALTHEIVLYFDGHPREKPRDIQFFNLLTPNIVVTLPGDLAQRIQAFKDTPNCSYLNWLRNAMQHRGYPITEHTSTSNAIGLPDDPRVEPGDETYDRCRDLVGTLQACDRDIRTFVLEAYDLARP